MSHRAKDNRKSRDVKRDTTSYRLPLGTRLKESLGGILRRLLIHRVATLGAIVVLIACLCAIFAPFLAPHNPLEQHLAFRLKPPGWGSDGRMHLLGTDQFGRDVLSRIIFGSRVSLIVGTASVILGGMLGLILGMASGYFGKWIDDIIMRIVDIQLSFPFIILALCIIAILGPSLFNLIVVLAVTGWVIYARVVRSSVLSVKEMDFVQAAKAIGTSNFKIILKHILPNVVAPFFVIASFQVARIIIIEAGLGFLGLGVPPPVPTWGNMLSDGREYLREAWWIGTFPGLAIVVVVLGINLLGDGLRDALDPKTYLKE
jgi:peptide/nickel transport system permease protein